MKMMSTGATFTVVETGYMRPTSLQPCKGLSAGEVGYITASIKTVSQASVGDTITLVNNPAKEPLAGYRKANPMVFCGIYPADGADYESLKEALEKLRLNDAALSFEPETSGALGFGFRCGFLGLLHLEIVQERLEENTTLTLSPPFPRLLQGASKRRQGNRGRQPDPLPRPADIDFIEEPIARRIFSPRRLCWRDYGALPKPQGVYLDMVCITPSVWILVIFCP